MLTNDPASAFRVVERLLRRRRAFGLIAADSTGLGPCRRCLEECASDEYVVSECTDTSDMVCERCSPECEDDEVRNWASLHVPPVGSLGSLAAGFTGSAFVQRCRRWLVCRR